MGPLCDMTKNIGFKMGFNWEHINHTMVLSEDGTLSENHGSLLQDCSQHPKYKENRANKRVK